MQSRKCIFDNYSAFLDNETRRPVPPAYFPPTNFVKDAFERMKAFFFSKKYSPTNSAIFPNLKTFWLFGKNHTIKGEKHLQEKNFIWYAFYNRFSTFTELKNISFFFKKNNFFLQKANFRTFLRNLTISVAFYGKFTTIWWLKNFQSQNRHLDVFKT